VGLEAIGGGPDEFLNLRTRIETALEHLTTSRRVSG